MSVLIPRECCVVSRDTHDGARILLTQFTSRFHTSPPYFLPPRPIMWRRANVQSLLTCNARYRVSSERISSIIVSQERIAREWIINKIVSLFSSIHPALNELLSEITKKKKKELWNIFRIVLFPLKKICRNKKHDDKSSTTTREWEKKRRRKERKAGRRELEAEGDCVAHQQRKQRNWTKASEWVRGTINFSSIFGSFKLFFYDSTLICLIGFLISLCFLTQRWPSTGSVCSSIAPASSQVCRTH